MAQAARARGRRAARVRRQNVAAFPRYVRALNVVIRPLHPHLGSRTITAPARRSGRRWRRRATSTSTATRVGTRSATRPITRKSELADGEDGAKLSPQGTPVEWTAEESWFFRLSKYQQPLLDLYAANPGLHPARQPPQRGACASSRAGSRTCSISRTSFDWGVPVPGSDGHVMYVWLDALTNYITGLGYPDDTELWRRYWPADVHLIGKDVVRFHAVYWPAFLMSRGDRAAEAGLRPRLPAQPRREDVEERRQCRRSDGARRALRGRCAALFPAARSAVRPGRQLQRRGDRQPRQRRARQQLRQSRAAHFVDDFQEFRTAFFRRPGEAPRISELLDHGRRCDCGRSARGVRALRFLGRASRRGCSAVFACNAYVDAQAPWALRKTDPERMAAVLGTLVAAVRELTAAIAPVIPGIGREAAWP